MNAQSSLPWTHPEHTHVSSACDSPTYGGSIILDTIGNIVSQGRVSFEQGDCEVLILQGGTSEAIQAVYVQVRQEQEGRLGLVWVVGQQGVQA